MDGRSTRDKSTYYFKDLSGKRFENLVALKKVGKNKYGNLLWECVCDCGNHKIYPSGKLTSGRATNCGCKTTELKRNNASKHGITSGGKPRTFIIWNGMKLRCNNPNSISYKSYGARGIKICKEWEKFKNFHYWAISNGYSDEKEIDRIDNDGDYCPENCRWVSKHFNRIHQRSSRYIEFMGMSLTISEWCRKFKISKSTAYKYLNKSEDDFIKQLENRVNHKIRIRN